VPEFDLIAFLSALLPAYLICSRIFQNRLQYGIRRRAVLKNMPSTHARGREETGPCFNSRDLRGNLHLFAPIAWASPGKIMRWSWNTFRLFSRVLPSGSP